MQLALLVALFLSGFSNVALAQLLSPPLGIQTQILWAEYRIANDDFIVKSGDVLTIRNARIEFADCKGIIVEKGGYLLVIYSISSKY